MGGLRRYMHIHFIFHTFIVINNKTVVLRISKILTTCIIRTIINLHDEFHYSGGRVQNADVACC